MITKVSFSSLCVTTIILSFSSSCLAYNCQNEPVEINISSQPVSQALKLLTKQTDCPISIDASLEKVISHGVKGIMTPRDGIAALARGTGLEGVALRQGLGIGHYEQKTFQAQTDDMLLTARQRVKEGRLSLSQSKKIQGRMKSLMEDLRKNVREQGFLSAGEKASYQRTLKEVRALL